ncbi:MAG: N-acetyl-gamma-glutamyl-phosphate reductase [Acidimicrobiales bacterium]
MTISVGIAGASGYVGAELLRLCAGHPELEVAFAGSHSRGGAPIGSVYPSLAGAYPDLVLSDGGIAHMKGVDLCFLALPHGESQHVAAELAAAGGVVVDLAADFRLKDEAVYAQWYGCNHSAPELLDEFVYGLPELYRDQIDGARLIAAPGCYPTAAALAIAPFVRSGVVETAGIVVDAASGVSGAGHSPSESTHFATVDENFTAYGLLTHRHTPEIEQATGATVIFTPHLAPMTRGILVTSYMRPSEPGKRIDTRAAIDILGAEYEKEPFVVTSDRSPSTKATLGSNSAHLTARVDERTGWLISLCAIDNLMKGAAGQAVQCANLALGLPETCGLAVAGMYP